MTDNKKSGIALVLGSFGGLITMGIHPTSTGTGTPAQMEFLALHSGIAHSLAMVSVFAVALGVCGLTQHLGRRDRLAFCGMVAYFFAAGAVMIATAVSGFIVPQIMLRMVADVPAAAPQWHIAIAAIFQINQAFSKIYTVAVCVAIGFWSVSAIRNGGLGRKIAFYGCLTAATLVLAIGGGWLRLNVHGMTVVVLAQGLWFIGAGFQLSGAATRAAEPVPVGTP